MKIESLARELMARKKLNISTDILCIANVHRTLFLFFDHGSEEDILGVVRANGDYRVAGTEANSFCNCLKTMFNINERGNY